MKKFNCLFGFVTMLLLLSGQAQATIIANHPLDFSVPFNGFFSVSGGQQVADEFVVSSGTTANELTWWGGSGTFAFDIEAPSVRLHQQALRLEGPGGHTDIPRPITISFHQRGEAVSSFMIDPSEALTVRWSVYSNGQADPRGIVDDMIFVVIADCHGGRVFHTGLPFQGDYLTFETREILVEAGTLKTEHPYAAFVEFPHVVDSRIINGVPGFTSYATATYVDLRTRGPASDASCPEAPPPMDTEQTDRMEPVQVPPD